MSPDRAQRLRLFFALWLPPGVGEPLLSAAQALVVGSARVVAAIDLHVTLCFLGAVEQSVLAVLCERVAAFEAQAFELEFDQLQCWPRSRVLVASSSQVPQAASALAAALQSSARAAGLAPAAQSLAPHVTLLRGVQAAAMAQFVPLSPPLRLKAQTFYLAQSHALESATATPLQTARYRRLAAWPLSAAGS